MQSFNELILLRLQLCIGSRHHAIGPPDPANLGHDFGHRPLGQPDTK
jgi:hypothetical protein